jgi:hypothetical protein
MMSRMEIHRDDGGGIFGVKGAVCRESCSNCKQFLPGYGFDFNYRLAKYVYFDSAASLFPGSGSSGQHGAAREALVGLKLGPTLERWGLFFNLRNGFIHYDKALVPDNSPS